MLIYESVYGHFEFDRRESIEKAGGLVLDMLVPRYSN
ncbi:MAG: hypothetical protein JWO09_907 [Bacteroidetes bacterium]|nr:hypothetical protein [Bacteroidota bacterium]